MGDEGEYWDGWQKPSSSGSNKPAAGRSQANGSYAPRVHKTAPQPSPLLKEYMINNGIPVK